MINRDQNPMRVSMWGLQCHDHDWSVGLQGVLWVLSLTCISCKMYDFLSRK